MKQVCHISHHIHILPTHARWRTTIIHTTHYTVCCFVLCGLVGLFKVAHHTILSPRYCWSLTIQLSDELATTCFIGNLSEQMKRTQRGWLLMYEAQCQESGSLSQRSKICNSKTLTAGTIFLHSSFGQWWHRLCLSRWPLSTFGLRTGDPSIGLLMLWFCLKLIFHNSIL